MSKIEGSHFSRWNRLPAKKWSFVYRHPRQIRKFIFRSLIAAIVAIPQLTYAKEAWQNAMLGQPLAEQQAANIGLTAEFASSGNLANFNSEAVSLPAWHVANWIIHSGDNLDMPFMIIDKAQAKVMMFDAKGNLSGLASALLGQAVGDDSVPGIGERKLSSILPEERTTPAGRFIASLGHNLAGEQILWVDYETAISLHRVVTGNAKERRAERLSSDSIDDKRISYGCINVSVSFFEDVVIPAFSYTSGVVYTLPETRDNKTAFNAYYELKL